MLAAASHGAAVLIKDMSGTTFCNSAGVHAIITAHRQITKTHTQFRLVATAVLRIFKLVGADQLTPTYPTLERHSPDRLAHWPASVINATNPARSAAESGIANRKR